MRFYFETSNAGGFSETHYWWSNPVTILLATANGTTASMSTTFDGGNWSDYFGHSGDDPVYAAGFRAALSNATEIGLSFGGGCFFENGVGTTNGGSFTLNTFTSP